MGDLQYLSLIPADWIQKYHIRSIAKVGCSIQVMVEKFIPQDIQAKLTTIFGEDVVINQETVNVSHPIESWQSMLDKAIERGASDIHLDPKKQVVTTRIRLDGWLVKTEDFDWFTYEYLLRIFKIRGKLNITEKRMPQEGGFAHLYGNQHYDIRVSTIPTIFGEKLSIRILPLEQSLLSLEDLGMSQGQISLIRKALLVRNGSIVVNGPTGSGKSTTLHVLLNQFNKEENHIITVEDPVEIQDVFINQVQVNEELGLSYANLLKRLLRQDPDVILLGEVRDADTARLACEASLTGHFFLTSIHTKSPEDVVLRLLEMKLEPYLIASSLNVIVSQRLVRKVCQHCKQRSPLPEPIQAMLKVDSQWKGTGCPACFHTGFAGRIGVYEIVVLSEETKLKIVNYSTQDSTTVFLDSIRGDSTGSLKERGLDMVSKGITTWEEIHRCIGLLD